MTTAIAFAFEAELAAWRARRPFTRTGDLETPLYVRDDARACVRAAVIGIRARRLDRLAPALFADGTSAAVVAGLAGALVARHRRGDILVAQQVHRAGSRRGTMHCDDRLVALAASCGARIVGAFLTVDHVVATPEAKRRLAPVADAVDMESADVLGAAASRGIPCVAIRVVGDDGDDKVPLDFERAIRADGTIDGARLFALAAARPWQWPALVGFALAQRRALGALAAFLDRFTDALEEASQKGRATG